MGEEIVFVVDDDGSFRRSTVRLIRAAGLEVRGFASAEDFLAAEPAPASASCLVLDVRMPGLSGLDLQRRLAEVGHSVSIVFMTGNADVPTSVRAMKAGAIEFLTKPFRHEDLLAAIRQGLDRDRRARQEHAELQEIRTRYDALTPREREVAQRVVLGLLNKQIAAELGISEITVKIHRRGAMRKMRAASLPELVRLCQRLAI